MCEMHSSISLGTVAKEYSESSAMILLIVLPSAAGLSLAEAIGEGGTGASPTFLLPPLLPLLPEWPEPALETGLDPAWLLGPLFVLLLSSSTVEPCSGWSAISIKL